MVTITSFILENNPFESSLLIHLRKWDVGPHSFHVWV